MMDRKRFWPHTYVSRLDIMNLRNVYERGCAIKRVWWRPKPVDPDAPIVKLGKAISLLDESLDKYQAPSSPKQREIVNDKAQ